MTFIAVPEVIAYHLQVKPDLVNSEDKKFGPDKKYMMLTVLKKKYCLIFYHVIALSL